MTKFQGKKPPGKLPATARRQADDNCNEPNPASLRKEETLAMKSHPGIEIREAQQAERQRKNFFQNNTFFFKLPLKSGKISTLKASGKTPAGCPPTARRQATESRQQLIDSTAIASTARKRLA